MTPIDELKLPGHPDDSPDAKQVRDLLGRLPHYQQVLVVQAVEQDIALACDLAKGAMHLGMLMATEREREQQMVRVLWGTHIVLVVLAALALLVKAGKVALALLVLSGWLAVVIPLMAVMVRLWTRAVRTMNYNHYDFSLQGTADKIMAALDDYPGAFVILQHIPGYTAEDQKHWVEAAKWLVANDQQRKLRCDPLTEYGVHWDVVWRSRV